MSLTKSLLLQFKNGNLKLFQRCFNIHKETLNITPEEVKHRIVLFLLFKNHLYSL